MLTIYYSVATTSPERSNASKDVKNTLPTISPIYWRSSGKSALTPSVLVASIISTTEVNSSCFRSSQALNFAVNYA